MAETKRTYPMIGANVWWKLRDQFQKSLPGNVSRSYLATVLGMEERSAGNLVGPLRTLGLVQEDGKPTERANHWRFDEDYPQVCKEIREEVYPRELLDAIPDAAANREGVVRWFMRTAGVGEAGARKMAGIYEILTDADPEKRRAVKDASTSASRPRVARKQPNPEAVRSPSKPARAGSEPGKSGDAVPQKPSTGSGTPTPDGGSAAPAVVMPGSEGAIAPSVHIDVQVHISADASADQIDQIFASMARHLYGKR